MHCTAGGCHHALKFLSTSGYHLALYFLRIVKLTSPNLNYVVLLGAFFLYASIYFYVLPSTEKFTSTLYCHIRAWLQPTGYFISFGTIMFKMWRVYFIFHNPSAKKKRKVSYMYLLILGSLVHCTCTMERIQILLHVHTEVNVCIVVVTIHCMYM
jgi:hypothetical protein